MQNKKQIINPEHSTTDLTPFSTGLHRLAKRLLGAKGFAQIELVKNWPDIVGETLSPYCLPLSLDFPKEARENGILRLLVSSGAFALEIAQKSPLIKDKINTFFGYPAVVEIKIIQSQESFLEQSLKDADKPQKKLVTKEEENYIKQITEDIEDTELKNRLQSFAESFLHHV